MARFDPGYTVADLMFYTGLIGGLSGTFVLLYFIEVDLHYLLKLLIGGAIGLVLGFGLRYGYEKATEPRKWPREKWDDDVDDDSGPDVRRPR